MSLLKSKTKPPLLSSPALIFLFVSLLLSLSISSATPAAQQTAAREISFPAAIQWNKQTGVRRYRLQIAADEKFQDIFFDGRVAGERYVANDLPAGYYFWRVAPADSNLASFSTPVRFFVSGGIVTTVSLRNRAKRGRSMPLVVGTRGH